MRSIRARGFATPLLVFALACGGDTGEDTGAGGPPTMSAVPSTNPLIALLEAGQPVFGIFSGEHTAEAARSVVAVEGADFVFYSLEEGPFDIPGMETYIEAMVATAGAAGAPPVALRVPPIREDREAAVGHVAEGLGAGAVSIVFPHVESVADAQLAAQAVGDRLWPTNPAGDVLNVLLIEDQAGVAAAREIVSTPGAGVVIPGPGDLSRAYEGNREAVENAIQTVLAACKEFDVPCGITAGPEDIGTRLEQGFRFIIVTQPEAVAVGLRASGRGE